MANRCDGQTFLERAPSSSKALAFIKAEIEAGRPFPSRHKIAKHMGWSCKNSNISECLHHLAGYGLLRRSGLKGAVVFSWP